VEEAFVQVREFFINEVIKRAASIVNPHLITSGISIYRKKIIRAKHLPGLISYKSGWRIN
jgi:hypothetical protein